MSLDVLYFLIEDEIFDHYLRDLFASAERYVAIFSTDAATSVAAAHVRHRAFTPWVEKNAPEWQVIDEVANPIEGALAHFVSYEK